MALHPHKTTGIPPIKLALRGQAILTNPRFNKGSAFTPKERLDFKLTGRLPYRVNTLEQQCDRAYEQLQMRNEPLRKNTFLQSLKDQNWTLYYSLLARNLKELVPIIYTPTEADAIANYSHLFRRSEGLYLTIDGQDTMEADFLEQTGGRNIDLIVCTDAEAILGIGDQGVGGIGISTAKSAIYTLIGGMDPSRSLSVMLDVGTNNADLLNDKLYVGWPHERARGNAYDLFIDKFVQLVRKYYPHSLLHFEDFGVTNARRLLYKYKNQHAVFNDDIQGTGAVTLACVMAAIGVTARCRNQAQNNDSELKDTLSHQRYVIFGAGSAGMGIAVQLRDAMVVSDNVSKEDANRKFWMVDREGLLYQLDGTPREMGQEDDARAEFIRPAEEAWGDHVDASAKKPHISLLDVVKKVKPTVLIGCSTAAGAFSEDVVKEMVNGLEDGARPIIMPLSNPSRLVEAKPKDLLEWTKGKALVATGSPFDSVSMTVDGKNVEFQIAECNNALIYPGVGFGAILAKSKRLTDTMLMAGAHRLAALSPAIQQAKGDGYDGASLLPDFGDAPRVNFEVGVAVAEQAAKEGNAEADGVDGNEWPSCREQAAEKVWVPLYGEYIYDGDGMKE